MNRRFLSDFQKELVERADSKAKLAERLFFNDPKEAAMLLGEARAYVQIARELKTALDLLGAE